MRQSVPRHQRGGTRSPSPAPLHLLATTRARGASSLDYLGDTHSDGGTMLTLSEQVDPARWGSSVCSLALGPLSPMCIPALSRLRSLTEVITTHVCSVIARCYKNIPSLSFGSQCNNTPTCTRVKVFFFSYKWSRFVDSTKTFSHCLQLWLGCCQVV